MLVNKNIFAQVLRKNCRHDSVIKIQIIILNTRIIVGYLRIDSGDPVEFKQINNSTLIAEVIKIIFILGTRVKIFAQRIGNTL
jgi:hypothetical protein